MRVNRSRLANLGADIEKHSMRYQIKLYQLLLCHLLLYPTIFLIIGHITVKLTFSQPLLPPPQHLFFFLIICIYVYIYVHLYTQNFTLYYAKPRAARSHRSSAIQPALMILIKSARFNFLFDLRALFLSTKFS